MTATSGRVLAYGEDMLNYFDRLRDSVGICQQANTAYP